MKSILEPSALEVLAGLVERVGRIQVQSAGERPEFGSQTGRGSLTGRDCGHFSHPGNPVSLPGLRGGGRSLLKPVAGFPCRERNREFAKNLHLGLDFYL
jgi:hypothetical protein